MPEEGSYRIAEIHRDLDQELHRLHVQTDLGWPKEARALTWFGLQDGMTVLELGSGPGFITGHLLDLIPHSVITCLEIDPTMIAQAEQYLQDRQGDRVKFVSGSIMDMPLPDNVYDIAFARFLFQHLPDPVGAAREVLRVLRPGGKLVIHDIDADLGGYECPSRYLRSRRAMRALDNSSRAREAMLSSGGVWCTSYGMRDMSITRWSPH